MGSAGDSERLSYLFSCTLMKCKLGCQINLFELLVKWQMLVERDFMLGESGG